MGVDVTIVDQAEDDLADVAVFTNNRWGIEQARAYVAGIRDAIAHLRQFPDIGKRQPILGLQVRTMQHESHVIVYERIAIDEILVLRIVHSRCKITRQILSDH